MNTFDGYIRRDGTNSKVLLDGGDAKALSSFIGTLSYNNNKITYTKADGSTSYDLVDLSNYMYSLVVATSDNLGGIRIGFSQSGKNYPVELDSNNKAYVTVPWEANTHYITRLYVGDGTAENKITINGNTRITITDDDTVRNYITLIGSGATTISSDDDGKITINSTNTTYNTGDSTTLNTGTNTEGKLWSAKTLVDYISDILGVDSIAITSLNTLINQLHDNDTATGILVELAKKLNTPSSSIGSSTQSIYWNGSAFTTIGYTIETSVPSNALFTDTKYSFYVGENNNTKEHKNVSDPYFKLFENNTPTSIQIKAGTGISVTSDANGNITIKNEAPDQNHDTHYITSMYIGENNDTKANKAVNSPYFKLFDNDTRRSTLRFVAGTGIGIVSDDSGNITITNSSPDQNHNTDKTGIKLGTISGTKKADSTVIINDSSTGLIIEGGTNKFSIGDGTNYIEVPITPSFTVTNKDATIGTSLITIATIDGTDIKAKIDSYLSLSGGTMDDKAVIARSCGSASVSWYQGRLYPIIKTTSYTGYNSILSMKTTNGSWDLGVYSNDTAYLTYITDTNYNANTNTATYQLTFPKDSGTIALTKNIPTNNNQLTNGAGYLTSQYTTGLYIGETEVKSNAATTNGNTYIKLFDDDSRRSNLKISGTQNVSVSSDANGNITITGPNLSSFGGGTITKISTGVGLTGGDITSTGTIKARLKSETASTLESSSMGSTTSRQYAVGVDKDGFLSVNIPWTNINSDYVTLTGDQTISGEKTFNEGKLIFKGNEHNNITNKYWDNDTLVNTSGNVINSRASIRNSLSFKWYNDVWHIGNIRSSSSSTLGFGIALEDTINNSLIEHFRITTSEAYVNGNIVVTSANISSYAITSHQSLSNYYTKSETDTAITNKLSSVLDIKIVTNLPTTDINTKTLYLMSAGSTGTNDLYEEYIYINKGTSSSPNWDWEKLGTVHLNYSDFVTALSFSNDKLQWTKGNTAQTGIEIGYASYSSKLTSTTSQDPNECKDDVGVKLWYNLNTVSNYAGKNYGFPCSNNANGILWIGTHSGNYGGQIGISSDHRIYYRYIQGGNFSTAENGGSWNKIAWASEIPTKSSWNYDDRYVTFVGVTDDNTNHKNQLKYVLNGTSNYFTVPYSTTSGTSDATYFLYARRSALESAGVQFIQGQIKTGSSDGQAYSGSSSNFKLLSFPPGATSINLQGTANETANVAIFRIAWGTTYWHDLHFSPNNNHIYHRGVFNSSPIDWRTVVETTGDKGNSTKPVYVSGGLLYECDTYPTKASWNYDDVYLKLSGGTMTGSITMDQGASTRNVGIVGTYDYTKAAAIWAMGSSYQIPAAGNNLGNLYGAAYVYQNQAGQGTMAGGHQFVWAENGVAKVALGNSGVWTTGGFYKNDSSNDYVLLGGGGHKEVSDFSMAHDHPYLSLNGGTITGTITISPTNTSGKQKGLVLHDPGGGADEASWIEWTSSSYSNGVRLVGTPDTKTLLFWDTNNWQTVYHSGNLPAYPTKASWNYDDVYVKLSSNITNLPVPGGIYWNPYVESSSDNTDVASITVVKNGVAGGTTLVLTQYNDSTDTIQFVTNGSANLYHNSNKIWDAGNDGSGSGLDADTLDGWDNTKFCKVYTRAEIGETPNFDNLKDVDGNQVNGFFESRVRETTNATGKKPPYTYCAPMLSFLNQFVSLQLMGISGEWYIRGGQSANVASANANINWDRIVINSGTWDINITGNAATASSITWDNVSGKPSSMPASDVYAWAKASTKPSYTLDEVSDGSTRKLANYLPLSGGTMTGTLTMKTKGTNEYNQGIRINRINTSNWALILIGKSGDATSGTGTSTAGDGAWLIGTPASSNSLIFNLNDASESKGLCLKGHGTNDMKWNNNTVYHAGNLPAYPTKSSWNYDDRYVKLSGDSTITGILTISPTNVSSYQDALVLHDPGEGGSEGAKIRFTSSSYTTGITLYPNSDKSALLIDGNTILTSANISSYALTDSTKFQLNDIQEGAVNHFGQEFTLGQNTVTKMPDIHGYKATGNLRRIQGLGFNGYTIWTVSGYFKADSAITVNINLCDRNSNVSYGEDSTSVQLTTDYVYHKFTYTNINQYNTSSSYNGFLDIEGSSNVIVYVKDLMIEEGYVAHAWRPSITELLNGTYSTGTWGINITGNAASSGNANKLQNYNLDDILPYGLENICTGATNSGGRTSLSNGVITTSGTNADTYFTLGISEPLEQDQIYTMGIYVTGVPSGNTAVWSWPVGAQSNSNWIVPITKNGWNWGTGYYNNNGNNLTLFMNDGDRGFYNSIQMSKFVIVKGRQRPYYSTPISQMSVNYANSSGNSSKLNNYSETSFFRIRSEVNSNSNADDINQLGGFLNATGNGSGNSNYPETYSDFFDFPIHYHTQFSCRTNFYWRTLNSNPNGTSWRTLIDSYNYTNYCATANHNHDSIYLKKGGDSMTGYLGIKTEADVDWNITRRESKIRYFTCGGTKAANAPCTYASGVSFMTSYCGFQLGVYGGTGITTLYYRHCGDSGTNWSNWYTIIHSGGGNQSINGTFTATAFYASSDLRLKNILTRPNYSAEQLASLPLVKYTWKDKENDSIHLGSIAQNAEEDFAELVQTDDKGYKSLDYATLGAIGVISLAREIVELRKEIKELKSKLYG